MQADFIQLTESIHQAHGHFAGLAARQVNTFMTLRNWLIGFCLVEFEQGTLIGRRTDIGQAAPDQLLLPGVPSAIGLPTQLVFASKYTVNPPNEEEQSPIST